MVKKLLFTFILLASIVNSVIPPEQAGDVAKVYAKPGEFTSPAISTVKIDVKDYWLAYYIPENNPQGKNGIAVVDADNSALIFDEKTLFKAHQFEQRLVKMQDFFAKNDNLKLNSIKEALDYSSKAQQQAEKTLAELSDKLQEKNANLAIVQTSLIGLTSATETFTSKIDIAQEQEQLFYSGDYSYKGLNGFLKSYFETLISYEKFLESATNYQQTIINKSNELTSKEIPREEFMSNLQSASKIGVEKFLTRNALSGKGGAQERFSSISDKISDELANNSVKDFLYRKASIDSKNVFNDMELTVKPILDSKIEIEKCTPVKKLQETYNKAKDKNKINSIAAFAEVEKLSTEAKLEATVVQSKFDKCVSDRKNSTSSNVKLQNEKEKDNVIYIGIAALLVVMYLASLFAKKKKEVENAASLNQDATPGSLFENKPPN